jgi:hypothetical protein
MYRNRVLEIASMLNLDVYECDQHRKIFVYVEKNGLGQTAKLQYEAHMKSHDGRGVLTA